MEASSSSPIASTVSNITTEHFSIQDDLQIPTSFLSSSSKVGCQSTNSIKSKSAIGSKAKFENGDCVSQLLGSVIMENSPFVRSSARVIQKMKENSARPTTPPLSEREQKFKEEKTASQKTPSHKPTKVTWTNLERNFFFDALNEFGKDFEAIANYINTKLKRKNATDQCFKTKEQIRTLYYQTFHKLSKYIRFSDDVKKPVQEIYALINYGEMRRKLQFVSEKNCFKIKDLVYKGYVIARSKGKNIRIKTPSSKALRKLNQLEDWLEDIKLPTKVEVNLRPASIESFVRVQNIAQNPVVRTTVPLQKKLINVIKTFQFKWRSRETNLIIEASKIQQQTVITTNDNTSHHKANTSNIDISPESNLNSSKLLKEPSICFRPLPYAKIHRPLVSITEFLSSFNICLNSYEERIGVKIRGETLFHERNNQKRQRTDSGCEKKSPESKKIKSFDNNSSLLENNIKSSLNPNETTVSNTIDSKNAVVKLENQIFSNTCGKLDTILSNDVSSVANCTEIKQENRLQEEICEILCDINDNSDLKFSRQDSNSDLECHNVSSIISSYKNVTNNESGSNNINSNHHNSSIINQPSNKTKKSKEITKLSRKKELLNAQKKDLSNLRPLFNEDVIRKIRKGWTISNANDITIGDLYIVFGNDSKLVFEYFWNTDDAEKKDETNNISSSISHPSNETVFNSGLVTYNGISTANENHERHKQQLKAINKIHESPLSSKLKQLLVIANLSDRMKKKSCYCGHICEKISKARLDGETANRSFISNKSYNTIGKTNDANGNTVFRQPLVPYRKPVFSFDSYKSKQSRFLRGGSLGSRQLFVQRVLPVQPGLSQSYDILRLKSSQTVAPIKIKQQNDIKKFATSNNNLEDCQNLKCSDTAKVAQLTELKQESSSINDLDKNRTTSSLNDLDNKSAEHSKNLDCTKNISSSVKLSESDVPDLAALMDLSLPSSIPNTKYLDGNTTDFTSIPPMNPLQLLKDSSSDSSKWLDENINDFSLSSLLGHLDEINNERDIITMDRSNISSNLSVISESSVDYMSKFAEIAASMQSEEKDL